MDLLYGRNAVAEALRAGRRRLSHVAVADRTHGLEPLLAMTRRAHVPVETRDRTYLDRLADTSHHQGVVAEVSEFPYSSFDELLSGDEPPFLLALDSLQDPQNFGTLLRTALAVGVSGVLIPEHRAVGVTPAVSNASAGAVEHLRIARVTNLARALEQLERRNVWVYGLAGDADQPYWSVDLSGSVAVVVGSEGSGLGRLVRETCDAVVQIPMSRDSIESLNASVAGSLVLYEAFRQRLSARTS